MFARGSFLFNWSLSTSIAAAIRSSIDEHARPNLLFASEIFRCFERLCVLRGDTASCSKLVFATSLAASLARSRSISMLSKSVSSSASAGWTLGCSSVAFLKQFLQSCHPGVVPSPFCLSCFARWRVIIWPPFAWLYANGKYYNICWIFFQTHDQTFCYGVYK